MQRIFFRDGCEKKYIVYGMGEFSGATSRFMELRWSHNNTTIQNDNIRSLDPAFAKLDIWQGGIERKWSNNVESEIVRFKSIKTAYQKKKTCTIIKTMIAGNTTAPFDFFFHKSGRSRTPHRQGKNVLEHASQDNHWWKNRSSYLHGDLLGC